MKTSHLEMNPWAQEHLEQWSDYMWHYNSRYVALYICQTHRMWNTKRVLGKELM